MLTVWKQEGEGLNELLDRVRRDHPETEGEPLSYAGRLDPLAEGEVLILVGEKENKDRKKYLGLDKEYTATVLLGVATDTYDILGVPTSVAEKIATEKEIAESVQELVGTHEFPYPPYSSKTVDGKPLWKWAREGRLDEVDIPTREMEVKQIKLGGIEQVSVEDTLARVEKITDRVNGDFRQEEIQKSFKTALLSFDKYSTARWNISAKYFTTCEIFISCGPGTYIRTLAHELGKKLGTGGCIYSLRRNRIIL